MGVVGDAVGGTSCVQTRTINDHDHDPDLANLPIHSWSVILTSRRWSVPAPAKDLLLRSSVSFTPFVVSLGSAVLLAHSLENAAYEDYACETLRGSK